MIFPLSGSRWACHSRYSSWGRKRSGALPCSRSAALYARVRSAPNRSSSARGKPGQVMSFRAARGPVATRVGL